MTCPAAPVSIQDLDWRLRCRLGGQSTTYTPAGCSYPFQQPEEHVAEHIVHFPNTKHARVCIIMCFLCCWGVLLISSKPVPALPAGPLPSKAQSQCLMVPLPFAPVRARHCVVCAQCPLHADAGNPHGVPSSVPGPHFPDEDDAGPPMEDELMNEVDALEAMQEELWVGACGTKAATHTCLEDVWARITREHGRVLSAARLGC